MSEHCVHKGVLVVVDDSSIGFGITYIVVDQREPQHSHYVDLACLAVVEARRVLAIVTRSLPTDEFFAVDAGAFAAVTSVIIFAENRNRTQQERREESDIRAQPGRRRNDPRGPTH